MRLLILCAITLLSGMHACAQRISLSLKKATFKELFREIEQLTGFSFIYTSEQVERLPAVTIRKDSVDLFSLLAGIFQNTPLSCTVKGNFIILVSGKSPQHHVKGKILTRQRTPVEGATIQTTGGTTVTVTDKEGYFSIPAVSPNAKLLISGAEIETSAVKINGRQYLEVMVSDLVRELEETVVPGYGSITKRFNTGNIAKISAADLAPSATGNLLSSLQGRIPGLLITASGGAPSSSYLMQVRGQQSLNPNPLINYRIAPVDQPLIIIDGVPFAPQNNNVNQLGSLAAPGSLEFYQNPYGGISPFSLINPEMIGSIEVLKDAVSTSVYGSRAANGIVLINTRQPKTGRIAVGTNLSTGLNLIHSRPAMLSTKDYLAIRHAAFKADGLQPDLLWGSPAYAPDLLKYDSSRQTDWSRYFFHAAAPVFNMHTTVSGKTGSIRFMSGLSTRQEKYLLKGNFLGQQFSSNNQIGFTTDNSRLNVNASVIYSRGWNRSLASPLLLEAIRLPPNYPDPKDQYGNLSWNFDGTDLSDNPAALLQQPYTIYVSNILISHKINYKLSKRMAVILSGGYNGFRSGETSIFPERSFAPHNKQYARSLFASNRFDTKLLEPQLEYNIAPGKFLFNGLSGLTFQQNKLQLISKKGTEYSDDALMNSSDNAGKIDERSLDDAYRYTSFFSRINLRYANRYLFHLSGRYETSSRFAAGSDPGIFSSIGLGWIFSEEHFREHIRWLDFGKVRFTYGKSGNDNIGYYHYLDAWSWTAGYTGTQTSETGLRDAALSWSVTRKLEAGLELRLFNNRLSLDISAYRHRSTDQLISQLSSAQPGRSRYLSRFPAIVENKGLEIIITAFTNKKSRISWTSQMNVSVPHNKLKAFPSIENSLYAGIYWLNKPLGTAEAIRYTGIDTLTGLYTFDQQNKAYFNTTPKVYGGWLNKLHFNNWTFELFVEFRLQQGVNYLRQTSDHHAGAQFNFPAVVHSGRKDPAVVPLQRPALPFNINAIQSAYLLSVSDAVYDNASYLRIKDLTARHHFIKGMMKNISTYIQLQNIATITSFRLTDPEVQSLYSYPLSKCITAGISFKLQ